MLDVRIKKALESKVHGSTLGYTDCNTDILTEEKIIDFEKSILDAEEEDFEKAFKNCYGSISSIRD